MRAAVLALAAAAALAAAPYARAGAWPREPGATFVALRADLEREPDGPDWDGSVYLERGLRPRVTLVAQFTNADDAATPSRFSSGIRFALGDLAARRRFAISLGVSTPPDLMGAMTATRVEAGLHWGRGFESRWGGGWATASARLLYGRDTRRPITDLYGLVGLRPAPGRMAMLAASRYADDGGVYWKLSPSLGYELRRELWLVPSLTQELSDDRSTSVGLALWFTF
jgi:hypothetical protein